MFLDHFVSRIDIFGVREMFSILFHSQLASLYHYMLTDLIFPGM